MEIDRNAQRWSLLLLPYVVAGIWNSVTAASGGIASYWFWASGVLALVGIAIAFKKRRLVVVQ